jgi:signal transduction histidine kinase
VLDLRGYDLSEQGAVELQGDWLFFWKRFIDPVAHEDTAGVYVPVPASWGQLGELVPGIGSKGFGSYNLKILPPENTESLAFRFTEVFSASGYYVNGKQMGFNGLPGSNRYQSVFGYAPLIFVVAVEDTVLDLVVHVSNFEHRSGGIRGKVEMGTPMQIMSARAERQLKDYFLMGAFLIIGIYFMALFQGRSDMYKLFFSLICLVMAFRIYVLSETGLEHFGWITGISRLRLEYLSFDLLVPLFVLMLRYVFPNDFPRLLFRIIIWVSVMMIVFVIVSPVSLFTALFPYFMYFVILAGAVVLYTIFLAWRRGRMHAQGFAVGIIIVVAGALNDMLYIADMIETGLVSHYTMFAFLMIYAIVFSRHINREMNRNERLSDEILSVNQNLENIVDVRTKELREKSEELMRHREELRISNEEMQREINIRNRFITILGHDIKGPVGYTSQVLDLVLSGQLSKEEEQELLRLTADNARSLHNLLENLLYWGRCQTGELKSMAVAFRLEKIVEEAVELYRLPLKEKGIELSNELRGGTRVFADKDHVKLITRNLLSNAVKYTDHGGEIRISATVDREAAEVVLEVADNGTGISPDELESLFTGSYHISTAGTHNEQGSGFGLKLCAELVALNKGTIAAESEPGKGSRFFVRLPMG